MLPPPGTLISCLLPLQAVVNPDNTFFSVKRFVGRKASEVQQESKQVPFKVSGGDEAGFAALLMC